MDFGLIYLEICTVAPSTIAKLSRNINTNKIKELVFNSDSEEQCTSNVSDTKHREDIAATKIASHNRNSKAGYSNLDQCF
jgi:dephospho-CoA kinase